MKIFLSWSGKVSQEVATVLRKWLPYMLHTAKPFVSSSIRKGDRWEVDLSSELKGADVGIVCVTPFNIQRPWMNFEAGALAHLPNLMPFLFRVNQGALGQSPLTQFQLTEFGSDDDRGESEFQALIESINERAPEQDRVSAEVLRTNFRHWWPEMKKELDAIREVSEGETRTAYRWLRTFDDLAIYDMDDSTKRVWLVSSDAFKFALRPELREKIESDVDKVCYRYLVPEPDHDNERAALQQLDGLRRAHPDRIDYRCFDRDVFEQQAASDYVIVESAEHDGGNIRAFVRIPVSDAAQEYWFEAEARAGVGFFHRFLQLWTSDETVLAGVGH